MKSVRHVWLALQILVLLIIVMLVLAPIAPLYQPVPGRDQGVYLYVGQQILNGAIPYRDVWDHKGPLIYYINAVGLFIADSTWGIWLLELIFLFAASVMGYLAIKLIFNSTIAFSSTILWLVSLPAVLDRGNSVEEYSLLFQFAAVYLYLFSEKQRRSTWCELLIGVTAALAFSLRPNNAGVHLSIVLVLFLNALLSPKQRLDSLWRLCWIVLGGAITLAGIAAYFYLQNALAELFDSLFLYNYYYSQIVQFQWRAFTKGYEKLTYLTLLGLLGWFGVIRRLFGNRNQNINQTRLALFLIVVFPIQLYLSLVSGRRYLHYFIAWVPVLALLTPFFIDSVMQVLERRRWNARLKSVLIHLFVYGLIITPGFQLIATRSPMLASISSRLVSLNNSSMAPDFSSMKEGIGIEYINDHTDKNDYVLVWGNGAVYNFLTERRSPSRFVYTYPFGTPGYVSQNLVDELLADIVEKKPMIIDATSNDDTIRGIRSKAWRDMPVVQELIRFIEDNYKLAAYIEPDHWPVFVYRDD